MVAEHGDFLQAGCARVGGEEQMQQQLRISVGDEYHQHEMLSLVRQAALT
jgi:hypothetical protein